MSDQESMANIVAGMRDLSEQELEQVFGGACGDYVDPDYYCQPKCLEGVPWVSYAECVYSGTDIVACIMGPLPDAGQYYCPGW